MVNTLTAGKPMKVLLAFSMPMLIGNMVQQFYSLVDLVIVGRFIGVNALASVGATNSTMFFVLSLVAGLTNGASVVVSQYYGYGDMDRMRQAVATSVTVLSISGVFLTVLGALITRPVLVLLNTPPEILDGAVGYLQVILLGTMVNVAYNGAANIIRALGDSVTPLIFLIISAILNIFLDILFIIVFHWGVPGVAWATVISQAVAAAACIIYAIKKMPALRLSREDFKMDREILGQTIKVGVPGGIQNSLVGIGAMTVQSVVNGFGPNIVAAYSASQKIDQLAVQPLMSLGMASATFTAQNIGAGFLERVRQGFWAAMGLCAIFCAALTAGIYLFGGKLMTMFVQPDQAAVLQVGVGYLHIVSLFYVILGAVLILEGVLRGAGDVMLPMFSCGMEIVARITMAMLLSSAIGYVGIWWSTPLAWLTGTVICGIRYLSGRWKDMALVRTRTMT